ncbi:LAFE_0G04192g1_1 [Lachancea fermentati]|uniref:LAFE_0G04192g1_1 n=1 Tax=Lachancea fermentati TaxID=4955 RepID=A0A1G4MH80_LACFM|nr:LAFE_0G04192g1_1 [Lachancea fermentati]
MPGDYKNVEDPKRAGFFESYRSILLTAGAFLLAGAAWHSSKQVLTTEIIAVPSRCGKIDAISPSFDKSIDTIFNDAAFREESLAKFSESLRIPTEIQDVNPIPADDLDYYKEFFKFHEYLERTFPLVHKHLKLEKVNDLGLLYTWEGKNSNLKPMMFTAHQDVAPVNNDTIGRWKYPPYSGYYDNETDFVWGRGACDCKNLLIAELEAVEQLIKDGFEPERGVLIALGFDEESSGILVANTLSDFLYERYGDEGIYSIVDEGGVVVKLDENVYVAAPITAEKGYVDTKVTVHGHGGHSSVPPDHTTIGIAAELISLMESQPFDYSFTPENPIYGFLTCVAEHKSGLPAELKSAILDAPYDEKSKQKLIAFVSRDRMARELLRTSQAVDIINGGIKANALPEVTSFLVNHRIDINSSVKEVVERDLSLVKAIAKKFGYGVTFDGKEIIAATANGYIEVEAEKGLEPAPQSPTVDSAEWDLFAGTIQNVFQNGLFKDNEEAEVYVTTSLVTGNTDTKYYWALSKNIYRFMALVGAKDLLTTIHSVNEHIAMSSHLSTIAFIYEYIVNVNERG